MNNTLRVLVTAACAPPGRNTFLQCERLFGSDLVFASDCNHVALKFLYGSNSLVTPMASSPDYIDCLVDYCRSHNISVVIPCIEEEILEISRNCLIFSSNNIKVLLPEIRALQQLVHKDCLYMQARKMSILTPITLTPKEFVSRGKHVFQDIDPQGHIIVKPIFGHGMKGVLKLSMDDAYAHAQTDPDGVIFQQCINASQGSTYMVGILCDKSSKSCRHFVSISTETLYPDGGPATAGVSVENDYLVQQSTRLLESVSWVGPAGVEWLLDSQTQKYYLIDVNPRLWGYSSLLHASGSDFVLAMIKLAVDESPGVDQGYKLGVKMKRFFVDCFE